MLRLTLSAVALAGVLATTHPVFADPLTTASDHAQAAAAETEQPAPVPAWLSSSDTTAPAASAGLGKTIAPAGFGWG